MNLVARNLNNVVLLLDLSQPSALLLVAENVRMYVSRGIPLRFGLVPLVGEHGSAAERVARVVGYLVDTVGRAGAMEFMGEVSLGGFLFVELGASADGSVQLAKSSGAAVDVDGLRSAYEAFVAFSKQDGVELLAFDEVMKEGEAQLVEARAYAKRLGVKSDPASKGVFFINGAFFVIDDVRSSSLALDGGTSLIQCRPRRTLRRLCNGPLGFTSSSSSRKSTSTGSPIRRTPVLTSTTSRRRTLVETLSSSPSPRPTRSRLSTSSTRSRGSVPFSCMPGSWMEVRFASAMRIVDRSLILDLVSTEIMDENEEDQPAVATIYLVADLESSSGRTLAKNALELLVRPPSLSLPPTNE